MVQRIDDSHRQLVSLMELEDDWNGYGEKAVTTQAFDAAWVFIEHWRNSGAGDYPVPVPVHDGGISFEWTLEDAVDIGVDIGPDGVIKSVLVESVGDARLDEDVKGYVAAILSGYVEEALP